MSRTREKSKGRASYSNFIGIPRVVADSAAFISLPSWVRALYVDLRRQHYGHNNGDICAADGLLKRYGWAHSTIHKGLKQLIAHGLIEKTRQGGIASMSKIPTLYAFTDIPTVASPSKGINGACASWAYKSFEQQQPVKFTIKKGKVSVVNEKVSGGDFQPSFLRLPAIDKYTT